MTIHGLLIAAILGLHGPGHGGAEPAPVNNGARHPAAVDVTRFITSRDVQPLPLPSETESFFFAILGDRTGGPADGVEVLAEAVREINLLEPDLVMTVGDLVEGYNQTDRWMTQMREFKGIMDELLCPWFPVAGNHDIYWRGPDRPDGEHEAHYETHFGPLWYAFEHKGCWFIVLYTDEGNPETGERAIDKPASHVMSDEQLSWLGATLERTAEAQHVFVFLHHPRWLRGGYGDDWDRVHPVLAAAGNVRAVFAGHIHRMRYDGSRDGIEYVALATTGGVQEGHAPEAGYLHHYNLVTVRPNQIAMSALPVGEVMDVRAITGTVSDETATLAGAGLDIAPRVTIDRHGSADETLTVRLTNPVSRPIEVALSPVSDDPRWSWQPDHDHAVIEPGETHETTLAVRRAAGPIDETFGMVHMMLDVDYLAEDARYAVRSRRFDVTLVPNLAEVTPPAREMTLALDGDDDCLRLTPDLVEVPDGPLTLECWMNARSWGGMSALVSKTESSEFALFAGEGAPSFWIHLDKGYVTVRAETPVLETGRWHHVAGVYDGSTVTLYVDGAPIATAEGRGPRRTNNYALHVGAELAGTRPPTDHFDGMIDEVRLSTVARYTEQGFTPARRFEPDEQTILLLHLDAATGPWVRDASPSAAHPVIQGDARIEPAHDD